LNDYIDQWVWEKVSTSLASFEVFAAVSLRTQSSGIPHWLFDKWLLVFELNIFLSIPSDTRAI
jgi:hypothetical protein